VLLAVPVTGAAILMAVLLGADLAELLQGSLRDMFTTTTSALMSEPVVLAAFVAAFAVVLSGGSILMFLVKGGTVDVLIAAHRAAGPIEREPITIDTLKRASTFTIERFTGGCGRLFRAYLAVGLTLMAVYAISGAAYLSFVIYGYRAATDRFLILGFEPDEYLGLYLSAVVLVSIILGVFNLIPIAPLDGFKVAVGLLPDDLSRSFAQLERWGPAILIALIALPFLTGGQFGILFEVMSPVINALARLFAGIDEDVFG